MKSIGEKLRSYREFLELTQQQVADVLNMTRNVIVNIENDKREVKSIELSKFSKLYGKSMEEILGNNYFIDDNLQLFARGFNDLSEKDQKEIIDLIKYKKDYKDK